MLFLELALIRWLGANVVHLSYFSNFVLLGSFLGIGLGFLIAKHSWSILPAAPVILALLVIFTYLEPVTIDRAGDQIIYFTSLSTTGPPAWLVLPLIFILVAACLAGPAEVVGRCFGHLRPLTAYRWDLVGSLIGIGLFTLMSFLRAPSVVWGVVVTVAFVILIGKWQRYLAGAAGLAMVAALLVETLSPGISWSPYYKIHTEDRVVADVPLTDISVNGVPHQIMRSASQRLLEEPQYGFPYERSPENSLDNVLIIGAGSGSDVAIALSKGAKHIDAVDIDPRIMEIGLEKNPDHPYDDPRVTRHVNDGRAFLETTDTKYDLILFALPDSLALVTGASQIRLESFLFTEQALTAAREHLTPDGVVLDVQLLPRGLADRPAGRHRGGRLRAHPLRRPARRRPGRGHGGAERGEPVLRDGVRPGRQRHRRRPPTTGRSCTSRAARSRRSTCGRWPGSC